MKQFVLYIICLFCYISLCGQKQGNTWYFGDHAGLNFNTTPPTPLLNGQTDFQSPIGWNEGCSSISDSSGSLLFYSNGVLVWDRFQSVMPNGSGLMGDRSSTQSCIIVPKPGSNRYYYVFTNDASENNFQNGLRYSIVDMCLNNNKGDVISNSKNTSLQPATTEKLICIQHTNAVNYWIITHKMNSADFYAFLLTSGGITSTVISTTGPNDALGWGQMAASSDGMKIAYTQISTLNSVSTAFFVDFNPSTGNVTNPQILATGGREYGVCFSPDNSKLYYTTAGIGNVIQYNMNAGNLSAIIASKTFIIQNGPDSWRQMELGPDGTIYVSRTLKTYISAITNPNTAGLACNYTNIFINLGGNQTSYGLPNFVAGFKYNNTKPIPCCVTPTISVSGDATLNCPGATITLTASGAGNYTWQPGGITGSSLVVHPMINTSYTVSGSAPNDSCVADFIKTISVYSLPSIGVNSAEICSGNPVNLSLAGSPIPDVAYIWQPGSVPGYSITVSPTVTNQYTLIATHTICNLSATAMSTVFITPTVMPVSGFSYNPICENSLSFISPDTVKGFYAGGIFSSPDLNVDVSNGNVSLLSQFSGTYSVNYNFNPHGCNPGGTSTVVVTIFPAPHLIVSNNVRIMEGASVTLTVSGSDNYRWTPTTYLTCSDCDNPIASPPETTEYCVTSVVHSCVSKACVTVRAGCENASDFSVPNAFTPNGDGNNDAFCLQGWSECTTNFNVVIFDRWGEKIYESNNPSFCWDGTYQGKPLSNDVFVYVIKATYKKTVINKKGNITLVR